MEHMENKISERFPSGYGDFALQSSDGVIFYFPRHILVSTSDFFRGMFELPTSDQAQGTMHEPLVVTETADALEDLLEQIDPKMLTPALDNDKIIDILEVARKYQIQIIFDRFEEEIQVQYQLRNAPGRSTQLLLFSRPLLVLYIALQHDIESVGKRAIQELARCSSDLIGNDEIEIPTKVFKHIQRLREERIQKYRTYIDILAKARNRSPSKRSVHIHTTPCVTCAKFCSEFLFQLEKGVEEQPAWKTFNRICRAEILAKCETCRERRPRLLDSFVSQYIQWAMEALKMENSEVVAWPVV
ncbi:hypothetical protein FRC14_006419 [Serendipita sp. 396]|nr:hypothetical protein FRC14_006419 [Serendipita sp. 396]KAG8817664.1 hypothetical protein FRC19_011219 [Serendipita sp. 401]KAG8856008.1 hypothetical protein FRC20_000622 [Serendipita sp. 405]